MTQASLLTLIILMFVGTGPGGTGGGIKVTTFGVVVASVLALLRGEQDTVVFRRRMPLDTVYRALSIGMLATVVVVVVVMILSITERASFLQLLFETTSALGTVGLSAGITSSLTPIGKILISLTMLIGRLGPLAVGFALVGRPRRRRFRYIEGEVFIG
jgi:trk system potassium uptake protein TrkH